MVGVVHLQKRLPPGGFFASPQLPCAPLHINVPYCHVPPYVNVAVSGGSGHLHAKESPPLKDFLAPSHHKPVIPMHAFSAEYSSAKYDIVQLYS